ncbi:MAG: C40 family peptidase [Prevotellaceae bacterium]|nr:C40 family peptidase [Prevotellaceae bacterium]
MLHNRLLSLLLIVLAGVSTASAQRPDEEPMNMPRPDRPGGTVREVRAAAEVAVAAAEAEVFAAASADLEASCAEIVATAKRYIGARYRRGMSGPSAFDCSGFTNFVFRQQNIELTRSSRTQFGEGEAVSRNELRPGDLVFFGGSHGSRAVGHVGIVTEADAETGAFKFIHASSTGVKIDDSSQPYYNRRYIGARRVTGQ